MRNRNLNRFLEAQNAPVSSFGPSIDQVTVYEQAVAELFTGRKVTHWMWFIFPQRLGLGYSEKARYYGIRSDREAARYAVHPVLGRRLMACHAIVQTHVRSGRMLEDVFGSVDTQKYLSCAELFPEMLKELAVVVV